MRVPHEVNLLDGHREEDVASLGVSSRYRVYWTRLPGSNLKFFGVVDTVGHARGRPLEDFVLLDAQQSDGRAHCVRVATAANTLETTAQLLGLRFHADALAVTP